MSLNFENSVTNLPPTYLSSASVRCSIIPVIEYLTEKVTSATIFPGEEFHIANLNIPLEYTTQRGVRSLG